MELKRILIPPPEAEAVLGKATVNAADRLGLTQAQLAEVIGHSRSQVSKLSNGTKSLKAGTVQFRLAALLVRLFRSLDAIVGGDAQVLRAWMRNPNQALNGRPIDLITTPDGLTHVLAYLDASRAKI